MKITQFQLKNGLNVFLVPQKEATSVAVELMVKAGSKHEEAGKEGLAHFLEHMAFKGTKKWPTALKLAKALDNVGAVYNASTGKERTAYWIKTGSQHLNLAMEAISQMLNHALLKQEEIDVERGVIVEELNMYEDRPMDKVEDLFEEQLLGDNPLGRSIIGKKKIILNLKSRDFTAFKNRWYQTGRMSLAVVGAVNNLSKTRTEIKRFFGRIASGNAKEVKVAVCPKKEKIFRQQRNTQQTHFEIGLPSVTISDQRKWPAGVLTSALGLGMSSRLWRAIREKRGWAYYVYAFHQPYSSAGFLAVKAGVKNEVANEAMGVVKRELKRLTKDLKAAEINRVKKMLVGRFLISIENSSRVASLLNTGWLFENKVTTPKKVVKRIEAVKFSEVKQFAQDFINLDHLRGAVIGPKA